MARIRTIKPKFWDDVKIGRIPRDCRLLYIGMWNFADDLGVVVADPVWLKSKIFPYDQIQVQQFESWLEVLEKTGFISLLTVQSERFYYLPTFSRHQVINKPNLDDVNICKYQLDKVLEQTTDQSRINTGLIPDQSSSNPFLNRKGKEEDKDSNIPLNPPSGETDLETSDDLPKNPEAKKKNCAKRKNLDLSFVEPSFQPIVADWLTYKSERGQAYRQQGLQACYSKLQELSNGSPDVARKIVQQSMANNYAGLFPLKTLTASKHPATDYHQNEKTIYEKF